MKLEWKNLDQTEAYRELRWSKTIPVSKENFTSERIRNWTVPAGGGLDFNYAAALLSPADFDELQALADEQQLTAKYRALLSGEKLNTGEDRRVLHHLTRGQLGDAVVDDGIDQRQFYEEQRQRAAEFSKKVHDGRITGSTGKKFDTVVQIGIGGSHLGPQALYLALKNLAEPKLKAFFISNVDPDDAAEVLKALDPESTLFILVSKSGSTQETLANRDLVLDWMNSSGGEGLDPRNHMIAVTGKDSPLADSPQVFESFYINDFIGGRYSSTSAVGGVILSLALGPDLFAGILEGAAEADALALEDDIRKNAALLDAMMGVYRRNIQGLPSTAVLPYTQALSRFPAHLQQLDMESNGKSVNRRREQLNYPTGPIVFGEPGTNGQHSFYQLLHQGTDPVPLQFIGFRSSQCGRDLEIDGSTNQTKLKANLAAQIVAFVRGRGHEDPNKNFEGLRPSTLLLGERLTPQALGALLAHFENKVLFQGFTWNLNSFDQEGVQLGKILTQTILSGDQDEILQAYSELLGIRL